MALALGKEARFVECHTRHSTKYLTGGPLLRILCRVLSGRHSAKVTPLPSVAWDTGQRLCLRQRNDCFSLPSALWHSANHFAECPRKSTRQRRLCRYTVCRALFAECDTRQSFCRVFLRLCRVFQALSKAIGSGSVMDCKSFSASKAYPSTFPQQLLTMRPSLP
jgi:hypothetical protein